MKNLPLAQKVFLEIFQLHASLRFARVNWRREDYENEFDFSSDCGCRFAPQFYPAHRTWRGAVHRAGRVCRGTHAQDRHETPWVEEGPFYPPKLPLDTDNDLLIVNNTITPAVGEITHLSGRLLNASGDPVRNATIEIWCVDHDGVYLADCGNQSQFDANFQGFGRFLTSSTGEYYFRTIKPVRYPGRFAPHIHFKIKTKGQPEWTTQLFIKGYPTNMQDGVYQGIGDATTRDLVTKDFAPVKGSHIGELAAQFDIVLGFTPEG